MWALFEHVNRVLDRYEQNLKGQMEMKFLSKVAEYFAKGLQIIGLFSPVVEVAAPKSAGVIQTVSQDLTEVGEAIVDAEQVGLALGLKGPDKLKVAAPKVADIILQSSMLANHKVQNPDLFNQGATKVADGMADILNSLHTDGIQVTNKQA
jgi:hypothetical protein